MNYSKAVFLINNEVRAVAATYEAEDNAKRTIFKTLDVSIKVGDLCIVPTENRHKMTVVKIVETDIDVDMDSPEHMNWIISVVDRDEYERTLANEQKAIQMVKSAELRQKRAALRDAMLANSLDEIKTLEISKIDDTAPKSAA
jgi:hypothetical protein